MSDIHIGENCARVEGTWYWKISAYINVLLYDVLERSQPISMCYCMMYWRSQPISMCYCMTKTSVSALVEGNFVILSMFGVI